MDFSKVFSTISIIALSIVLSGCLTEKEKQEIKDRILLSEAERRDKRMKAEIKADMEERERKQRLLDLQRKTNIMSSAKKDIRKEFAQVCRKQDINCMNIDIISADYAGKNSRGEYVVNYEAKVLHHDDGWTRSFTNYQGSYYYRFIGDSDEFYDDISIQAVGKNKDLGMAGEIGVGVGLTVLDAIVNK